MREKVKQRPFPRGSSYPTGDDGTEYEPKVRQQRAAPLPRPSANKELRGRKKRSRKSRRNPTSSAAISLVSNSAATARHLPPCSPVFRWAREGCIYSLCSIGLGLAASGAQHLCLSFISNMALSRLSGTIHPRTTLPPHPSPSILSEFTEI
ncbi:hypothetical protein AAFF_G00207850 [Aldrovandia affinis]|uniref:Uncharacterized protein n=1 Tax=Aldrovandia affinis TaxID=143900 RepID=A0AAD7RHH6_9TELE|nr:hypothetical protein AAFF_G00207850 [Aldrovandia affinis]